MRKAVEGLKSKMSKIIKGPQKQKMKFTLLFQVEYEADPETYTDPDPIKMGKEDSDSANSDPFTALRGMADMPGARFRVKCEPVQTPGEKAGLVVEETRRPLEATIIS